MKKLCCAILVAFSLFSPPVWSHEKPKVEYIFKKDPAYRTLIDEYWDDKANVTMILRVTSDWGNYLWFFEKNLNPSKETPATYNLSATLMLEDHGGTQLVAKFQDFSNEVYWPKFLYRYCMVDDTDGDGTPEFYLTYFADSDGLDAKPLKVIVYSTKHIIHAPYVKSKVTAYYPAGNEEDRYHLTYDTNWANLPKPIAERALQIVREVKAKNATGLE